MERRIRVIKDYAREFENPISMKKGSHIKVIRKNEGRYKEWFWCKNEEGIEAFVPSEILEIEGSSAVFLQDYDSREHTVYVGDILIFIYEMGGWAWVKKSSGQDGWIPKENTEPYDSL